MKALDVTTIGEGQLRLTTGIGKSLGQASALELHVAGTEANVAGLLSRLGREVGLVTALPDNPLGRRVIEEYRAAGIHVDQVALQTGGRVALYFVEENPAPLPSRVFYDRADSVFSRLRADQIDFDYLSSSRLLHLSGITAALTDNLRDLLSAALTRAAELRQQVSFDINYRHNLWSPAAARRWLDENLTSRVAVLSCARRDAETLYGLDGETRDVAARLADRFGAATVLVSDGDRPVHCHHDGTTYSHAPHPTAVIDRVGAGDALLGGFLHGYLDGDVERGLRLGVAAAALTLARRGEQLRTTESELNAFGSGDIRR